MTEALICPAQSFVTDPVLADTVKAGFDIAAIHSPTQGPNRLTMHVPTETTRLSLGEKSSVWNSDVGITGYTDNHIHFETKSNDKTVVSLGGPATTSGTTGYASPTPPSQTQGYSMVTTVNAWHDAKEQHYFISRASDISLRTKGSGTRAVIQADKGAVNIAGGVGVNVAGGGVSIGAASELETEDVKYGGTWKGLRPHSTAVKAGNIGTAVAAAALAIHDFVVATARTRYEPGKFTPAEKTFSDKSKRAKAAAAALVAAAKVAAVCAAKEAPPKSIKMDAEKKLAAVAGQDFGMFGMLSAGLGAAGWATVSSMLSTGLKAVGLASVGGGFVAVKGFRKAEIGSDFGTVSVGAQKEIHLSGEKALALSAKNVAHVGSSKGWLYLAGEKKLVLAVDAGGWGLRIDDKELALGAADDPADLKAAKIKEDGPALRIKDSSILLKASSHSEISLADSKCTVKTKKKVHFNATSGMCTINGAKILFK